MRGFRRMNYEEWFNIKNRLAAGDDKGALQIDFDRSRAVIDMINKSETFSQYQQIMKETNDRQKTKRRLKDNNQEFLLVYPDSDKIEAVRKILSAMGIKYMEGYFRD